MNAVETSIHHSSEQILAILHELSLIGDVSHCRFKEEVNISSMKNSSISCVCYN